MTEVGLGNMVPSDLLDSRSHSFTPPDMVR